MAKEVPIATTIARRREPASPGPLRAVSDHFGLSGQEWSVLQHLCERGRNQKEAAGAMGISLRTLETYITRICAKTGSRSLFQAIWRIGGSSFDVPVKAARA